MKKNWLVLALLVLPCLAQAQELWVRIGHAGPLSGPLAERGQENENGVRLALEEYQARGLMLAGHKLNLELLSSDDQAEPKNSVVVARQLVDAGVKGVVGHLNSSASLSAARVYAQAGIPMISPSSTSPALTHQGLPQVFRSLASDALQAQVLGKFARTHSGRRIALIDDHTAYGEGLANGIEQVIKAGGGKLIVREFTSSQTTDFSALLGRLKHFGPDGVIYAGAEIQGSLLLRQMRQMGMNAYFLTGDGGCTEEFIHLAGEAMSDKVFCSRAGLPLKRLADPGFVERYQQRFGEMPRHHAPQAYAAASALIEAMLAANSAEPVRYLPALKKLRFRSVAGELSFDARGEPHSAPLTIHQFKAGAWQALP